MGDIRIVVAGATGRMGRAVVRLVAATEGVTLWGALDRSGHAELGQDAGLLAGVRALNVPVTDDPLPALADAHGLIDFTAPENSVALADLAAQARIVHVIGTTGFAAGDEVKIRAAARHAIIVKSGNMSLGVTLLAALVARAARVLPDYDIAIVEMHHRMKRDAPSGTALLLGRAAAEARESTLEDNMIRARDGQTLARPHGAIGFASLRGGTVVGEHEVILAGPHERIVLGHVAEDRAIFAQGALAAVKWGQGKKPGLYAMADVLGIAD